MFLSSFEVVRFSLWEGSVGEIFAVMWNENEIVEACLSDATVEFNFFVWYIGCGYFGGAE